MQALRCPLFVPETARLPVLANTPGVECCVLIASEGFCQRRVESVYFTAHELLNASLEVNLVVIAPN